MLYDIALYKFNIELTMTLTYCKYHTVNIKPRVHTGSLAQPWTSRAHPAASQLVSSTHPDSSQPVTTCDD